jgi:hypothetical protein
MLGEIVAATTGLKAISDIAVGLQNLKTTAEIHAKAIELNQQILAVQKELFAAHAAQTALVDRVRDLEGQIARMKNWDAQKQRYKLAAPFPGCMVYALQKSMSGGETPHYLCASCFDKGERSILQGREGRQTKEGKPHAAYYCPNPSCRSEATTRYYNVTQPQYFEDIQPQT